MKPQILAPILLALATPGLAHATVYFDSITGTGPTIGGDGASDDVISMANSFTAATPDFSRVIMNLAVSNPASTGSALVYLVPDDNTGANKVAGAPRINLDGSGNFLSFQNAIEVGAVADKAVSTSGTLVSLNFSAALAQAASASATNDEYWIGLVLSPDSSLEWNIGTSTTATEAGQRNFFANTVAGGGGTGISDDLGGTPTSVPYDMIVDTPEPASAAIFGGGLACLGYLRRRVTKKARPWVCGS